MIFDYVATREFTTSLEVKNIGNCCIKAKNKDGDLFFLRVKSIMGQVNILKALYVNPNLEYLQDKFEVSYKKMKYSEKAIQKEIKQFLNDFDCKISEAYEIEEAETFENLPNIEEYFKNC